ncbi:hypothetical protein H0H93_016031, partial [Arthromyces matolae]
MPLLHGMRPAFHTHRGVQKVSDLSRDDTLEILTCPEITKTLDTLVDARMVGKQQSKQLAFYATMDMIRNAFDVQDLPGGVKTLVYRASSEEVILDVVGILEDAGIPPIKRQSRVVTAHGVPLEYFASVVAPPA